MKHYLIFQHRFLEPFPSKKSRPKTLRVSPSVRAGKLSVCRMILNKPWHRAWCDFFNLYVVGICNFGQHPAIGARIGADKADGLALIVILKHVAAEECVNGMAHKTIDVVLVELVHQESGIDTQRVARKRMVVDCRHYLVGRQPEQVLRGVLYDYRL